MPSLTLSVADLADKGRYHVAALEMCLLYHDDDYCALPRVNIDHKLLVATV